MVGNLQQGAQSLAKGEIFNQVTLALHKPDSLNIISPLVQALFIWVICQFNNLYQNRSSTCRNYDLGATFNRRFLKHFVDGNAKKHTNLSTTFCKEGNKTINPILLGVLQPGKKSFVQGYEHSDTGLHIKAGTFNFSSSNVFYV